MSYARSKRLLDVVGALALLLPLAPVAALFAVLIRLRSPGPVFFAQSREGLGGRPFVIRKLRTMHTDAGVRLHRLLDADPAAAAEFAATACLRRDPRIAGHAAAIARRFSIDEVPQLWNVLVGEMSLVGPRPLEPHFAAALFDPDVRAARLRVRPGLSGLWQVSRAGKADITRTAGDLDLAYVRSRSLRLDLLILARTPRAVLSGGGLF